MEPTITYGYIAASEMAVHYLIHRLMSSLHVVIRTFSVFLGRCVLDSWMSVSVCVWSVVVSCDTVGFFRLNAVLVLVSPPPIFLFLSMYCHPERYRGQIGVLLVNLVVRRQIVPNIHLDTLDVPKQIQM